MTHAPHHAAHPASPHASGIILLQQASQAAALLYHPVRLKILQALLSPDSAAGLSRRMNIPRQTLNYHVGELLHAKLLRRAGRRRNRNFFEQRYVTTARGFVFSPALLGSLAADPSQAQDTFSAAYLLGLASLVQRELGRASESAAHAGKRLATLSIETKLRFRSAHQRQEFAEALRTAILDVVARHAAPYLDEEGHAAEGRGFRLVLGCYPIPSQEVVPEAADQEAVHE
ncbi:MAG TPA: helix-turn-helix domain-containing protein [Candidatus Dormibacteraeota bacterium]|nr:helix-turn-helix domain-containing protein [Candidatus Dormibacteraeota bacterium]